MIQLADKENCTACGACAFVCPKQCITMEESPYGLIYPVLNAENCITCKLCQKACPIIAPISYQNPSKAYAAWSSDEEERRTSASGGIAAEMYKWALQNGYDIVGAAQNEKFSVSMEMSDKEEAIAKFKNSKYVFSSTYALFPKIKSALKDHRKIMIIGLPCQVAAIRKIFKDDDNLFLVDVVCHGTTPLDYLLQHIHTLQAECKRTAARMSFRDPEANTGTFTFTLYDRENHRFYAQRTKDGDTYQFGYHRAVTYRENCYHCRFAREQRISDVTLSDYKGLGKMAPCSFSSQKVSSVLVNTVRGGDLVRQLIEKGRIVAEERPVREPIEGDLQLRQPSVKKPARFDFEKLIVKNGGDFEKTMKEVVALHERREKRMKILNLPRRVARKIKRILFGK